MMEGVHGCDGIFIVVSVTRLAIVAKEGVPTFGPPLPYPPVFEKDAYFRQFMLAKMVNAGTFCWWCGYHKNKGRIFNCPATPNAGDTNNENNTNNIYLERASMRSAAFSRRLTQTRQALLRALWDEFNIKPKPNNPTKNM